MFLTRYQTPSGARWALNGDFLTTAFDLGLLLELPASAYSGFLSALRTGEKASGQTLAPIEPLQEVWASGVTYLRSRDARQAESETGDIYARVYVAERPELFLKAIGWRVMGDGASICVRSDSAWNVPEPELTLVVNRHKEIVGYCAGNDVSSRSIEGANPLYLPQAKVYAGSCALGPGVQLVGPDAMRDLAITLEIQRDGKQVFFGETATSQMKRTFEELVDYLCRELAFPFGVFLMTGTGIVPPDAFTLQSGDVVHVQVGELVLVNIVQ